MNRLNSDHTCVGDSDQEEFAIYTQLVGFERASSSRIGTSLRPNQLPNPGDLELEVSLDLIHFFRKKLFLPLDKLIYQ